jgi:hypothetical protein
MAIAWVQRAALVCAGVLGVLAAPRLWALLAANARPFLPTGARLDVPVLLSAPGLVLAVTAALLVLMALWHEVVAEE